MADNAVETKNNGGKSAAPNKKLRFFGLGKLRPYVRNYKGVFVLMIVANLFVGVCNTIVPLFQRYAIDNFILEGTLDGMPIFAVV